MYVLPKPVLRSNFGKYSNSNAKKGKNKGTHQMEKEEKDIVSSYKPLRRKKKKPLRRRRRRRRSLFLPTTQNLKILGVTKQSGVHYHSHFAHHHHPHLYIHPPFPYFFSFFLFFFMFGFLILYTKSTHKSIIYNPINHINPSITLHHHPL